MPTGTVKWFNAAKRFGFITPDDGKEDVFVHISAVKDAGLEGLETGQRLDYELGAGRNGRTAAVGLKVVE